MEIFYLNERVKEIDEHSFPKNDFKVCVLPDSVEVIHANTFLNHPSLEKIVFVDSAMNQVVGKVQKIGSRAFCGTKLKEFIYSQELIDIGTKSFYKAPLERFECHDEHGNIVESKLESIGSHSLDYTKLEEFVYSSSLNYFGENFLGTPLVRLLCKDEKGNCIGTSKPRVRPIYSTCTGDKLEELSWNSYYDKNIIDIFPNIQTLYCNPNESSLPFSDKKKLIYSFYGEDSLLSVSALPGVSLGSVELRGSFSSISKSSMNFIRGKKLILPEGTDTIPCYFDIWDDCRKMKFDAYVHANKKQNMIVDVVCPTGITKLNYKNLVSYLHRGDAILVQGDSLKFSEKLSFVVQGLGKHVTFGYQDSKTVSEKQDVLSPSILEAKNMLQLLSSNKENENVSGSELEEIIPFLNVLVPQLDEVFRTKYQSLKNKYSLALKMQIEYAMKEKSSFIDIADITKNLMDDLTVFFNEIYVPVEKMWLFSEINESYQYYLTFGESGKESSNLDNVSISLLRQIFADMDGLDTQMKHEIYHYLGSCLTYACSLISSFQEKAEIASFREKFYQLLLNTLLNVRQSKQYCTESDMVSKASL